MGAKFESYCNVVIRYRRYAYEGGFNVRQVTTKIYFIVLFYKITLLIIDKGTLTLIKLILWIYKIREKKKRSDIHRTECNNHKKCVKFGDSLLSNEKKRIIYLVIETFLENDWQSTCKCSFRSKLCNKHYSQRIFSNVTSEVIHMPYNIKYSEKGNCNSGLFVIMFLFYF